MLPWTRLISTVDRYTVRQIIQECRFLEPSLEKAETVDLPGIQYSPRYPDHIFGPLSLVGRCTSDDFRVYNSQNKNCNVLSD